MILVPPYLAAFVVPIVMLLAFGAGLAQMVPGMLGRRREATSSVPLALWSATDWAHLHLDGRSTKRGSLGGHGFEQRLIGLRTTRDGHRRRPVLANLSFTARTFGPLVHAATIALERAEDRIDLVVPPYIFWPWQLVAPGRRLEIRHNGRTIGHLLLDDDVLRMETSAGTVVSRWLSAGQPDLGTDPESRIAAADASYGSLEFGTWRCALRKVRRNPETNRPAGAGKPLLLVGSAPTRDDEPWLLAHIAYTAYVETALAAQLRPYRSAVSRSPAKQADPATAGS